MNKKLKGKTFSITEPILKHLKLTFDNFKGRTELRGYNAIKNIIKNKQVSYENAKRIKNLLEKSEGELFNLLGGDRMLGFLNDTLKTQREAIENVKAGKKRAGIENAYIKSHEKNYDNTGKVNIPIAESKILILTEAQYNKIKEKWQVVID
jgi:hypothetical protein